MAKKLSIFVDESGATVSLIATICSPSSCTTKQTTLRTRSRHTSTPSKHRFSQAADYICTMELTAIKYADHAATATDEKLFGKWSGFKKGILKETRKKLV